MKNYQESVGPVEAHLLELKEALEQSLLIDYGVATGDNKEFKRWWGKYIADPTKARELIQQLDELGLHSSLDYLFIQPPKSALTAPTMYWFWTVPSNGDVAVFKRGFIIDDEGKIYYLPVDHFVEVVMIPRGKLPDCPEVEIRDDNR